MGERRILDAMLSDAVPATLPGGEKLQRTCFRQVEAADSRPIGAKPIWSGAKPQTDQTGLPRPNRPVLAEAGPSSSCASRVSHQGEEGRT